MNVTGCQLTDTLEQRDSESQVGQSVLATVQDNQELLQRLLDQVSDLSQLLSTGHSFPVASDRENGQDDEAAVDRLHLEEQIAQLESQVEDLRQQNRELASKVAGNSVRETISNTEAVEALSWNQRKELILQQLEEECFDAESFVSNMAYQREGDQETPELYLERLVRELESRNQEIQELRHLLDSQSKTHDGQFAVGAAAIAGMIDSDELVQQERERLQRLQVEWEEKFREGEIEASLERAKLSRERQQLARKQAELAEELEHMKREARHQEASPSPSSRRWLAKLGLSDQS